jgi:hypothetical protein
MQNSNAPYTPRNPRLSGYYRCVEDFFEELERVHEERYQARLGVFVQKSSGLFGSLVVLTGTQ